MIAMSTLPQAFSCEGATQQKKANKRYLTLG